MPLDRAPRVWLPWLALVTACYPGDPSGAPQVGLGDSSSSIVGPEPTTTPTSAAPTSTAGSASASTSTSTETSAPTSSSGGADTSDAGTSDALTGMTGEAPSPSCGDGIEDPDEECDLGHITNSDEGACTLSCKDARCGDRLVWAGKEECDDGADNNDDLYGGCTTKCQRGPRCNDGQLQHPEEECDHGADNGNNDAPISGVPCDDGCRFQARLAFLSSVAYRGGELGGVEGANLKCQSLAKQAQFDNATGFKAWLSDAQHSPVVDFIKGPVGLPYVRPDGVRVADDWNDLSKHGPAVGITVTETGEMLLDSGVWTGTAPSGKAFDTNAHCKAWSSSSPADQSRRGISGIAKQQPQQWMQWSEFLHWTSYASDGCHNLFRLYCIEQ